jgi:hypothetical protein
MKMPNIPQAPRLNPTDVEFVKYLTDINQRLENLEKVTQPQYIDWYGINPALVERINDYKVNITGISQSQFAVGDKVRIKQAGDSDYRYFYIYRTANLTELDPLSEPDDPVVMDLALAYGRPFLSGSDSLVSSGVAIEEFSISKSLSPSGMGGSLFFDTVFKSPGGTTRSTTENVTQYSMSGNLLTINLNVNFSSTITDSYLKFDIPLGIDLTYDASGSSRMAILTSGGSGPQDVWLNIDKNTTQLEKEVWLRPYAPFAVSFADLVSLDTTVSMLIDNA